MKYLTVRQLQRMVDVLAYSMPWFEKEEFVQNFLDTKLFVDQLEKIYDEYLKLGVYSRENFTENDWIDFLIETIGQDINQPRTITL